MSEHECIIGMYFDFDDTQLVTVGELKELIEECPYRSYSFNDYCDKRKSTNLTRFEFCPYCGKKIDWKKIKEENKDEEM